MTTTEHTIPDLEESQKRLLKDFILEFLPPTESKRKYTTNEINYVTNVINLFTVQNFDFKSRTEDLLNIFDDLNYSIFKKKSEMDYENKKSKPNKKTELWIGKESRLDLISNYIYIEIPPKIVKDIRRTCAKLPSNTNSEKIIANDLFKNKLKAFVNMNTKVLM